MWLKSIVAGVSPVALAVGWLWLSPGQPIGPPQQLGPAPRCEALAHRYHGIKFSTHTRAGQATFTRGGQQCKLWTDGCVQFLNKAKGELKND